MLHLDTSVMELGLIALAFVSSANALVAEPYGSAFSVDAVASTAQRFDPIAERNRLSSKYPSFGHQDKRQTQPVGQQGSVEVNAASTGLTFLVPTVVGNQTFDMIFDTGSSDFWVYSNESSIYQSLDHPVYIPTASAELLPNYTWSIAYTYGDKISGVVFRDVVKVGPVIAEKQSVQSATIIQPEVSADGIVGLASSLLNTVKPVKQKTLFDTLEPTLQRKVFAANLKPKGTTGSWDFGYIDKSKYTGEIAYAPLVNGSKYWEISVNEYAVGEGSFGNATVGSVIVDSGTSLVYLPSAVVEDYYSKIEGYEYTQGESHVFPCNSTVPDFHFKIQGGAILSILGKDVNFAVYDRAKGTCAGAIASQLKSKYSILGSMFMKNYYVIHSREEEGSPKMGFASH